jgi:hypothetical protein
LRGAAGIGLGTTIKYLRGTAGIGLGTTINYLRCTARQRHGHHDQVPATHDQRRRRRLPGQHVTGKSTELHHFSKPRALFMFGASWHATHMF